MALQQMPNLETTLTPQCQCIFNDPPAVDIFESLNNLMHISFPIHFLIDPKTRI